MIGNTPLFFSAQGSDADDGAEKEMKMMLKEEISVFRAVLFLCAAAFLLCGCETVVLPPQAHGTQYVDPNEVIAEYLTKYDFKIYDQRTYELIKENYGEYR